MEIGKIDNVDDNGVPADAVKGRPEGEVDLMRLDIKKPNPDNGDKVKLTIVGGSAVIWSNQTKTGAAELAAGSKEYSSSDLPKTLWIEATNTSGALRDIVIKAEYGDKSDTVKATGVWATLAAESHVTKEATGLFAENDWAQTTTPPKNRVELYEGVGLRPPILEGIKNVILVKFSLLPNGIGQQPNISFDIARQAQGRIWIKRQRLGAFEEELDARKDFSSQDERANDDDLDRGRVTDESATPTGTTTSANYFYVADAVGTVGIAADGGIAIFRANFKEFVRVRFDGTRPSDNTIDGSRCSDKFEWHSRLRVQRRRRVNIPGLPTEIWVRASEAGQETDQNSIGPTHKPLEPAP